MLSSVVSGIALGGGPTGHPSQAFHLGRCHSGAAGLQANPSLWLLGLGCDISHPISHSAACPAWGQPSVPQPSGLSKNTEQQQTEGQSGCEEPSSTFLTPVSPFWMTGVQKKPQSFARSFLVFSRKNHRGGGPRDGLLSFLLTSLSYSPSTLV